MSSPVNMMERNFVSADRGESNYLKTMRAVAQAPQHHPAEQHAGGRESGMRGGAVDGRTYS